jgi:hypothetical protein
MKISMWVYIKSEPDVWTTGFYDPHGNWQPDADFDNQESAAKRASWLNGRQKAILQYDEEEL